MNQKEIEKRFLDLLEGKLSQDERKKIERAIAGDYELHEAFKRYKSLLSLEQKISQKNFELSEGFTVQVMEQLEKTAKPLTWRKFMKSPFKHLSLKPFAYTGAITFVVCTLFVTSRFTTYYDSSNDYSSYGRPQDSERFTTVAPAPIASESHIDKSSGRRSINSDVSSTGLFHPDDFIRSPLPHEAFEKYGTFEENSRHSVRINPVSTFSIDVDTGSYTNMRRFLRMGRIPPPNSVRTEEFLNYFEYDYPRQTEEPFILHSEIAPSPFNADKMILKLGIKTRDIEESTRPWNLVFLIDVSGSMSSPDKLGLIKESLKFLTKNMRDSDKLSIVTYAGSTATLLEGASGKEKEKILHVLNQLNAGGATFGSGGIQQAYAVAQSNFIQEGENRVIIATDGDFNVGIVDQGELLRLIEEKRKSGVTLTTIGVGSGNYNEALSEQLANKGNGNYFYLDSFLEATKVFGKNLFQNIETVAKDVKVQIEFNPAVVSHYRLMGYDNRALKREDFENDAIDAGETGSGHVVTVLYEVALTGSEFAKKLEGEMRYEGNRKPLEEVSESSRSELGFVKVRYKEPEGLESKLLTFPVSRSLIKESQEAASTDFKFAVSVAAFAELLKESPYAEKVSFEEIAKVASSNLGKDEEGSRREFVGLVRTAVAYKK